MGDMSKEPSMEDILSSIRRVIEREDATRVVDDAPIATEIGEPTDEPLELTQAAEFHEPLDEGTTNRPRTASSDSGETADNETILSSDTLAASRQMLASLASLKGEVSTATPAAAPTTIDDLVRESLRPMLKAWLDEHLPGIVEAIVTREVGRITRGDA